MRLAACAEITHATRARVRRILNRGLEITYVWRRKENLLQSKTNVTPVIDLPLDKQGENDKKCIHR